MSALALVTGAFLAIAASLVVLVRGPSRADRVVALDLLFGCGIVLCITASLMTNRKEFLDVGIAVSLMGFVTTIGWSRLVELAPRTTPAVLVLLGLKTGTPLDASVASAVPSVASALSALFLTLGAVALVFAGLGTLRFNGALRRQHAAAKACTSAMLLVVIGAGLHNWSAAWTIRLTALVACLLITLPFAAARLASAAITEQGNEADLHNAPIIDD